MESTLRTDSYYGPNAYDSRKVIGHQVTNNHKFSTTIQRIRNRPLPRHTSAQCREFFANDIVGMIELIRDPDDQAKKDIEYPGHETQYWSSLSNPKAIVGMIKFVSGLFTVFTSIGIILLLVMAAVVRRDLLVTSDFYLECFLPTSICFLIYWSCKQIQLRDLVSDKNNIHLNRINGTIEIPRKKQPPAILPFEEFDAYLTTSVNPSGSTGYHLSLEHRYSELRAVYLAEKSAPWEVNLLWEYWQQYMDISKPLPDTPKMEPFRSRDPVTADHDKKVGRPPDFWKNMDEEIADGWYWICVKAAKDYPWGKTREEAIASGWQPSPYNEDNLKALYQQSSLTAISESA